MLKLFRIAFAPENEGGGEPPAPAPELKPVVETSLIAPKEEPPKEGEPPKEPPKEEKKEEATPFDPATLTLPEGMKAEGPIMDKFSEIAKARGLSQEAANELLAVSSDLIKEFQTEAGKPIELWNKTQTEWVDAIKTEFPAEKLIAAQADMAKAFAQFGTPAAQAAFNLTGAGNNPDIFRMFASMAKALSEGTSVEGKPQTTGARPSLADSLYPQKG